jgi:hypothetical protein
VVDDVAFSVVNQTDHGGVTWACWCKNLELPTHKHPATRLHHLLGGRTGAAADAGSARQWRRRHEADPLLTPALLQLAILPQLNEPRHQPQVPRPKPSRISFSRSAWFSRRQVLFLLPHPLPAASSHARRPAADSPHTPKKLIATPMGVCLAPPRCAVTASAPANEQSLCSAAGGLTARFASRAWSTNTRVHETCTSACGAATVARDCA